MPCFPHFIFTPFPQSVIICYYLTTLYRGISLKLYWSNYLNISWLITFIAVMDFYSYNWFPLTRFEAVFLPSIYKRQYQSTSFINNGNCYVVMTSLINHWHKHIDILCSKGVVQGFLILLQYHMRCGLFLLHVALKSLNI